MVDPEPLHRTIYTVPAAEFHTSVCIVGMQVKRDVNCVWLRRNGVTIRHIGQIDNYGRNDKLLGAVFEGL
jgi:hypothetical protein